PGVEVVVRGVGIMGGFDQREEGVPGDPGAPRTAILRAPGHRAAPAYFRGGLGSGSGTGSGPGGSGIGDGGG
ncbi:hypothetical protein AB0L66_38075, partial [Streptomyces sp. NPDC052207]